MGIIVLNIIVALFGIGISYVMSALIKRFSNEEKVFDGKLREDFKFDIKLAIITPIALIAFLFFFGISEEFFIYSFLVIILIMDMFIDIKAQIIPNGLNMLGFLVGIVYMYFKLITDVYTGIDLLLGMFVGAGIFLLIALFALVAYKKEGMGLGDVKLMGMLGLFFGVKNIFQIFILSFTVGAIISILLLVFKIKKMDEYIDRKLEEDGIRFTESNKGLIVNFLYDKNMKLVSSAKDICYVDNKIDLKTLDRVSITSSKKLEKELSKEINIYIKVIAIKNEIFQYFKIG